MNNNYKIKVNIEIVKSQPQAQHEPNIGADFQFGMSSEQECYIDENEQVLLQTNPVWQDALSTHLSHVTNQVIQSLQTTPFQWQEAKANRKPNYSVSTHNTPPTITSEQLVLKRLKYGLETLSDTVEVNDEIRGGIPVLKDSRIPIAKILAELGEDTTITEIAEDYELNVKQVKKVIESLAILLDRSI